MYYDVPQLIPVIKDKLLLKVTYSYATNKYSELVWSIYLKKGPNLEKIRTQMKLRDHHLKLF